MQQKSQLALVYTYLKNSLKNLFCISDQIILYDNVSIFHLIFLHDSCKIQKENFCYKHDIGKSRNILYIMNTKKYSFIDYTKLIMAICVISIHTHPLENCHIPLINNLYMTIIPCAVPFFFLVSGFLIGKKLDLENRDRLEHLALLKKYLIKFIKLYIIWSILYLPLAVLEYNNTNDNFIVSFFKYIRNLLFIGEHYNSWHLWYLLSTIYSILFLYIFYKKEINKYFLLISSMILFIIGAAITSFFETQANLVLTMEKNTLLTIWRSIFGETGRLLYGPFYIVSGLFLYKKILNVNNLSFLIFIVEFIFGFWITFLSNGLITILSQALLTSGLVGILATLEEKNIIFKRAKTKKVSWKYRKISIVIYFMHMWLFTIFCKLRWWKEQGVQYGMEAFVVTTLLSILLGIIIVKLNNNKINRLFMI